MIRKPQLIIKPFKELLLLSESQFKVQIQNLILMSQKMIFNYPTQGYLFRCQHPPRSKLQTINFLQGMFLSEQWNPNNN
jgi:hypothetical protein